MSNTRVKSIRSLTPPEELLRTIPNNMEHQIVEWRQTVSNIISGRDGRLLVVVGPCSIHDTTAALEYGNRLKRIIYNLSDNLFIVMRVYFEKPRTTIGWKGHINDPDMNGTFNINNGLASARNLLCQLSNMGIPCGCEFLDTISPQYLSDFVVWGAIGARTTESQVHRELSSGLSVPIGFKNGTTGNINIAVSAIKSSISPHCFLGVDSTGKASIVQTKGNPDTHIILRGGTEPNYFVEDVTKTVQSLSDAKLNCNRVMIDLSHGNSQKMFRKQIDIAKYLITNYFCYGDGGYNPIFGVMIESNLIEGKQNIPENLNELKYGVSVTDACLGWTDTIYLLRLLHLNYRK